jgi:GT2 family glycosyltransferase
VTGPRVSVVIPNRDGAEHLRECLAALGAQTFGDFETIVVDNGSTDASAAIVGEAPRVRWLPLGSNRGFPAAANAGIAASTSAIVVLLNNDTAAEPEWLERLVGALDGTPSASFAASKLVRYDDAAVLDAAGDAYSLARATSFAIGHGAPASAYDRPAWVFGACAAAAAYRRPMLDDVGGFDEEFFFLLEDVDLDLRAQAAGHRCLYVPEAVVRHKRGASSDATTPEFRSRELRNRIWVPVKSLPGPLLALWWLCFCPRAVLILCREALNGWTSVRLHARALGQALRAAPAKRRAARGLRRVRTVELLAALTAKHRPLAGD